MSSIVVCTWGSASEEAPGLLTLARRVGAGLGAEVCWLALGSETSDAANTGAMYGAAQVHRVKNERLEGADAYVEVLARYCERCTPSVLLFPQTFEVRVVAPRLAGRLGGAIVMNALGVDVNADGRLEVTASAYGGDTHAVYRLAADGPRIVCVMPDAVTPETVAAPARLSEEEIEIDLGDVTERIRIVQAARREGPRLEDAQVIVAGGRGLGGPSNFALVEELARALGGLPGASRPIVDDGWTDASRQVGLTGKAIRPALYIALGISGASQHMAGCAAAKTIVAVNRDPDAAIFRYARYGIVGDCLKLIPELIQAAEGTKR